MKGMTDQKMVDYSKQIIRKQRICGYSGLHWPLQVYRHSSMTNFELFDMFRRCINYGKSFSNILF